MSTKRVEAHQSGDHIPHSRGHTSRNADRVLRERQLLGSCENTAKNRDHTSQAPGRSNRSRDPTPQRKAVEHRSRDPTPRGRGSSTRNPNQAQDDKNKPLRSRDPTPQRKVVEHQSRDRTPQTRGNSTRNANWAQNERNQPLRSRDLTPQRKVTEHQSEDCTPQARDRSTRSRDPTPQRKVFEHQSRDCTLQARDCLTRSRDPTPQRKVIEQQSRDCTPQARDRSTRSRDPTPQRKVLEHQSGDHITQARDHSTRNTNRTVDGRNQPLHSRDPTPQRKNIEHQSRDRTPQGRGNSMRNTIQSQDGRNQPLRSRDLTPQRKVVDHQSRDHTPQGRDPSARNENRTVDERYQPLRSRDLTPQGKVVDHQSRDRTPRRRDRSARNENQAVDERNRPIRSPQRKSGVYQSRDRTPQTGGNSTRNANLAQDERNQPLSSQDHTSPKIVEVHRSRGSTQQSQDYSFQYHDRSPHMPLRDHRRVEEDWSRDRTLQSRDKSYVNLSRSMDERDQSSLQWDRTPHKVVEVHRNRDRTSQSSDYSPQSHDRISSRSRDHTPQRIGTSWDNVHEPRHVCSSDRRARSHDHTPQSRVETSRSRDHTPDTSVNRSRDELRRIKNPKTAQGRDWSPIFQAIKQKIYSRRDKGDGKSQDGLSPVSGEKKSVRPGAPSEPNEYNFNYKRRGLFVIINNKNFHPDTGQQSREGTDVDAERLEERFQDLGFEVKRYDDVSRSKMSTLMYDAAAYDHSDADCFGCAILSHGLEGRVYGTDGYVTLEVLVMPFKGDKCPSLVGKPKLFFLQACRGLKMDYGVDVSDSSISSRDEDETDASSTVSIRKIPIEADFLFAYSTVPGYYSWRNNQDGSWFIQALCIVLENYGMKMELLHMLTHVNRIVAYEFASCTDREFTDKMKQMPCVVSMLTRYVYFRHKKQDIR